LVPILLNNEAFRAIRKLAAEGLAAAIGRVKGAKRHGTRTGNWLTQAQAEQMLALPNRQSNQGKRDRVLLCLLIGCGLRREELALLSVDHIGVTPPLVKNCTLREKGASK
jgi:site-specific recombinase XerD